MISRYQTMRILTLVWMSLVLSGWSFGQTTARSGGATRPGGVVSHQPVQAIPPLPPPGVTPGPRYPGKSPVADPRLGAGGVRGRSGNIVYPGTPGRSSQGSIVSPGIPSVVQPVAQPVKPRGPRGGHPRGPRQVVPVYVPVYGLYGYTATPNVIEVNAETLAQSNAEHVIEVGEEKPAEADASSDAEAVDPDYWLIALRGGLIYAAVEFGVEHRALWFVTKQGDEYVVPLAEVDAAFSKKLNADRGYAIELDLE